MRKSILMALAVLAMLCVFVSCDPGQDHVHSYTEEVVSDLYKYSAATCTSKAVYFKSCKCGMPGMEKFEAGELAAHDYVGGV